VASGWVRYHSDETAEKEEIKKVGEEARATALGAAMSRFAGRTISKM